MIIPGVPMAVAMAVSERDHVDWRGGRFILLGRVPGTALGVAVVAIVSSQALAIVIGSVVIAAVAVSVFASHLHPGVTPATATATGVATGFTGTAAAIDGPPLALLYQHDPPPVFRSTLATQFTIGTVFTLTGLLIGGQLHGWQLLLGAVADAELPRGLRAQPGDPTPSREPKPAAGSADHRRAHRRRRNPARAL